MSLFSAFTGSDVKDAAQNAGQWSTQLRNSQNDELKLYNTSAVNQILNSLKDGTSAYGQQQQGGLAGLGTAYNEGRDYLTNGYNQTRADLTPYAQAGGAANTMYSNSLGLNGADGNAAATGAFQASPGYQWQVDQATDAAARKANSLGMAASGNTLSALATLGSNLANQEYGGWQDRLMGLGQQGFQAAQGLANASGQYGQGMAGLAQNYGNGQAALYGKGASDLLGANMQGGLGVANSFANLGTNTTNLAGNFMNNVTGTYMKGAEAEQKGSENLWGGIGGLASSFFGAAGKAGGIGKLFG